MSKARLVPLTRELLALAIAGERDPIAAEMAEGEEFPRRVLLPNLAFAMLEGGYVIGAGGLIVRWSGRWECWLIVTAHARPRHLVIGARFARNLFDKRQRLPVFRRIEAFIRADRPWTASFARALGLSLEGRCRAWGPDGADYALYARIAREPR